MSYKEEDMTAQTTPKYDELSQLVPKTSYDNVVNQLQKIQVENAELRAKLKTFCILGGNPFDGWQVYGPYTADEADGHCENIENGWILPMEATP